MRGIGPGLVRAGQAVRRWALRAFATLLILVGLVVFPLPIPIGLLMIVTGLALLISSSHWVADLVRGFRRRHPGLDAWLREQEPRIPVPLRMPIRKTDPLRQAPGSASADDEPADDDEVPWT